MTAHRVARVLAAALRISGACLLVAAYGLWAHGWARNLGTTDSWVIAVHVERWLLPVCIGWLVGSTLVTVGSGLVLREVLRHLRFPRLTFKLGRGALSVCGANLALGVALLAQSDASRRLAPHAGVLLLCLAGAIVLWSAHVFALGWVLSDEHLGLLALHDMTHVARSQWSAQAGYEVFAAVLADAFVRKDVQTARVLSRRLSVLLLRVLSQTDVSGSASEAARGAARSPDVSLAMVQLLMKGFSRIDEVPMPIAHEAGSLVGVVVMLESACANSSEIRAQNLLERVASGCGRSVESLDALWAGFLQATMLRTGHREAALVAYWRAKRVWTTDDPRWVVRPAEQMVALLVACARGVDELLPQREASRRTAEGVCHSYQAITRDVGSSMKVRSSGRGDHRMHELPLALLDAIHARVMSSDLGLTADARMLVIGEYEEARTRLTRTLYGTATVRRAAAVMRG